jgi:hypothetical protein
VKADGIELRRRLVVWGIIRFITQKEDYSLTADTSARS